MTTSPFLRTLSLLTLTALLAQQTQALAQEPTQQPAANAPQAVTQPEAAPVIPVPKGTYVNLVLTEQVSSATATKGQTVRMAVSKDVLENGVVLIPRGTPATGVVKQVARAIPGKSDGSLRIVPQEITMPNGLLYRLRDSPPGEDACGDMGPCWALIGGAILLSPLILAYAIVFSPWLIASSIQDHKTEKQYRATHPAKPEPTPGQERVEAACTINFAYTSDQLSLIAPSADSASTTANRDTLDALCPAHPLKVQPVAVTPQRLPVPSPTELSADPHPALAVQP